MTAAAAATLDRYQRVIGVGELKRAWDAVASGVFRPPSQGGTLDGDSGDARGLAYEANRPERVDLSERASRWRPGPGEVVVPVLGCVGSCGASTLALAIATAAVGAARVVECAADASSGLAGASTAELGGDASGWTRGTRGDVLIDRLGHRGASIKVAPIPIPAPGVRLTVVDGGFGLALIEEADAWLTDLVRGPRPVVLVTPATVPGLRRLEAAGAKLERGSVVAAVVGPSQRHWPKSLMRSTGPLTRDLDDSGRLIAIPVDRSLAVAGVDSRPLPKALVAAARTVLDLVQSDVREGNA